MDHQQQHAKVERFLKLGYSHADILRVLESLHHDAQTNDILEELIKTCQTRTAYDQRSASSSPKLVSRGCSPSPGQPRPGADREPAAGFRPVVIDGSNVAMSHGDKKVFSCQGLQLAVSWFWDKGLRDITVFVPLWRKEQPRPDAPITGQNILHELERRKILVYTPSRCVNGKRVVCYDDRFIVKLAFDSDGIIVSNDNYRDLQTENPQWKKFIEDRLLMYTFANDKFMPPYDPLGRNGPTIDDFLRRKPKATDSKLQHCPYGKKCTYGVKCKFYHPERANQSQLSVADELRALRDRAKNFSPKPSLPDTAPFLPALYEPEHGYSSSTPPLPTAPDHGEHFGHQQRDSGGLCPSPDVDEAFCSMENSMSRRYAQDVPYGVELPSHSYSSGVASCSLGHDDFSLSGSYRGSSHRPCPSGGGYQPRQTCSLSCAHPTCSSQYGWPHRHTEMCPHHHHHHHHHQQQQQTAWSSCPVLPPHNGDGSGHVYEKQYFRRAPDGQTRSVPRDPWLRDSLPEVDGRDTSPCSKQRKALRSQLSTLFPQSTVEQVMNAYPEISDMSELIPLIQSSRASHFFL